MAIRSIRISEAQLNRVVRTPGGPVGRYVGAFGAKVTRECKVVANERLTRRNKHGVSYFDSFHSTAVTVGSRGPRMSVENDSKHAYYIEKGTRAHPIPKIPKTDSSHPQWLKLPPKGGFNLYYRQVQHPGSKQFRVMEVALRRVVERAR